MFIIFAITKSIFTLINKFLRYTGEYLRSYPQVRFTRTDESLIADVVLHSLGLDNMGQLRDRYEGQAFLDKTLRNVGAMIAVEKYLSLKQTDAKEINIRDFQPKIATTKGIYSIVVFDFGTLPVLELKSVSDNVIFVIQKDKNTFSLCGFADRKTVIENLVNASDVKVNAMNLKNFIGFKHLKPIEEI